MIFLLTRRSLRARPVRGAVLAGGFGLGVAVTAALLGVAAVILEQAQAPALLGGGDVIVDGASGRLPNARFVLSSVLRTGPLAPRVAAAAPTERATLYLIDDRGATPVRVRGGIPSLEGALHDPETTGVDGWTDTPADRAWASPDPGQLLLAMDRFHPIPDVPARAASWAEWLYFNGRSGDARFYLTFLAGPRLASGRRRLAVRLQLDRAGVVASYADATDIDEAHLLAAAPNLTVGNTRVRLVGGEYRLAVDLPAESGRARASGALVIRTTPGRSLPPVAIRGAGGWVSGYVVPVVAGALDGTIGVGRDRVSFDGGVGYHDHNWGFWDGVTWTWGQVQAEGLSIVYGRVHPPADAADASRVPAFLLAFGRDGPVGFATDVTIDELDRGAAPDPGASTVEPPARIAVKARSASLDLVLNLEIVQAAVTRWRPGMPGGDLSFLQLRAEYHVAGRAGRQPVDFKALGSAETFRGR